MQGKTGHPTKTILSLVPSCSGSSTDDNRMTSEAWDSDIAVSMCILNLVENHNYTGSECSYDHSQSLILGVYTILLNIIKTCIIPKKL